MYSRAFAIGGALVAAINDDSVLSGYTFVFQKKAFNRTAPWLPGAFLCPIDPNDPTFENSRDERVYRYFACVAKPSDQDLVGGMGDAMAAIERVFDVFLNKAHASLPGSLAALNAVFATQASNGQIAPSTIQYVTSSRVQFFMESAFRDGFDVSGCMISVSVLVGRLDVSSLGA